MFLSIALPSMHFQRWEQQHKNFPHIFSSLKLVRKKEGRPREKIHKKNLQSKNGKKLQQRSLAKERPFRRNSERAKTKIM
jgi:hypothetical protein